MTKVKLQKMEDIKIVPMEGRPKRSFVNDCKFDFHLFIMLNSLLIRLTYSVRRMLYGFGDSECPLQETLDIVDDIVCDFICSLVSFFLSFMCYRIMTDFSL